MQQKLGTGVWLLVIAAFALLGGKSYGQSATATISSQQLGPSSYEYNLTLTNTGSTPIGTFWFGWFPGYNLLPSHPTSITSPSGWSGEDVPDTYGVGSVQWTSSISPLGLNQTLGGLSFTSPDTPATMGGMSAYFGFPVEFSYVYAGAPEVGGAGTLTPTTVAAPEPSSLLLLLAVPMGFLMRRRAARGEPNPGLGKRDGEI